MERLQKRPNRFEIVSKYPKTCNIYEIRRVFREFENRGVYFDVLVLDYISLMKSLGKSRTDEEEHFFIATDLKMLMNEQNIILITAAQLKGGETKKRRVTMGDMGYCKRMAQIADKVYGINKLSDYLYVTVTQRDGVSGVSRVFKTDFARMTIKEDNVEDEIFNEMEFEKDE